MQKALIEMNVQLHRVVSDVTGVTGMSIIRAILAGERDPQRLALLKDPRAKRSIAEIAAALVGDYRVEHLFVLQQDQTALGGFYRRIRTRSGSPMAITATAHKLARIFYHLWTTGEDFVDAGAEADEQQYQQRVLKHLKQRAKKIGFDLVPELIVG